LSHRSKSDLEVHDLSHEYGGNVAQNDTKTPSLYLVYVQKGKCSVLLRQLLMKYSGSSPVHSATVKNNTFIQFFGKLMLRIGNIDTTDDALFLLWGNT